MTTREDTHGPNYSTLTPSARRVCNSTDETYIRVGGKWCYLYRAITAGRNSLGNVIEGDHGRLKRILGPKGTFKNLDVRGPSTQLWNSTVTTTKRSENYAYFPAES